MAIATESLEHNHIIIVSAKIEKKIYFQLIISILLTDPTIIFCEFETFQCYQIIVQIKRTSLIIINFSYFVTELQTAFFKAHMLLQAENVLSSSFKQQIYGNIWKNALSFHLTLLLGIINTCHSKYENNFARR